jgi:hypothetical protein
MYREDRQCPDEAKELHGASGLGDHESGGCEARRIGKEPLEEEAIATGAVQKGN